MMVKVLKISAATIFKIRLLPVPVHKQNQEAFEGNQSALLCSPPASLQQLPQGQGGGSVERVLQPGKNFSIATTTTTQSYLWEDHLDWIISNAYAVTEEYSSKGGVRCKLPPPCQSPVPGEETKESKQQD